MGVTAGSIVELDFFFFFKQKTAYEMLRSLVGSEICIRDRNSTDIDVLCSPISYFDRGLDGGAPSMSAAESVALAGKMWLNEDDTATYLSSGDAPGSTERVTTLAATNAQLIRNVGQEALRNFATWWMD